jgi:hypothetical protein
VVDVDEEEGKGRGEVRRGGGRVMLDLVCFVLVFIRRVALCRCCFVAEEEEEDKPSPLTVRSS